MNNKKDFKEQLNTILRFDKEISKRSNNRYAVYVIWFVLFFFCCFMPFMGVEAYIMAGTINFINVIMVYSGAVVAVGENGRLVRVEVSRLYNLNINAYIASKCIMMAKCAAVSAVILAVVAIIEAAVTDWGRVLGCLFWIFATYLANVIIVIINEKIRYYHAIK